MITATAADMDPGGSVSELVEAGDWASATTRHHGIATDRTDPLVPGTWTITPAGLCHTEATWTTSPDIIGGIAGTTGTTNVRWRRPSGDLCHWVFPSIDAEVRWEFVRPVFDLGRILQLLNQQLGPLHDVRFCEQELPNRQV